jgi:hypothetical protein
MRAVAIVLLSILAAVVYGIVHDQVTARVCLEYFTVFHPPVFDTESPTLQGLGWGVIATWWVGLLLGVPLAAAARLGPRPPRPVGSMVRPILGLLGVMGACALIAGLIGYGLGWTGAVVPAPWIADALPPERHARFLADLWAHNASYLVGFLGGIVVIGRVWRSRRAGLPSPDIQP